MPARQKAESNLTETGGKKRPTTGMQKLTSIIIVQKNNASLE
jgi:hypothetical protein